MVGIIRARATRLATTMIVPGIQSLAASTVIPKSSAASSATVRSAVRRRNDEGPPGGGPSLFLIPGRDYSAAPAFGTGALAVRSTPTAPLVMSPNACVTKG